MKKIFEKVNWKIFNLALWIEIILSYFLPFRIVNDSQYQVGFPIPFLFVNAVGFGISPFLSMHFNPLGLSFNGITIHFLLIFMIKLFRKNA